MQLSLSPDDLRPLVADVVRESLRQLADIRTPSAADSPESLLVDVPTAARLLSLCEKSVWNLTNQGDLPAVRVGRRVLYDPADLKAWIARTKTVSRPAAATVSQPPSIEVSTP